MKMKKQIEVYLDGKLSASERVAFLEEVKTNDEIDQWFRQNIENAEDSLSEEVKQRLLANICPPVELKSKSNVRSIWTVRHIAVACVVMALMLGAGALLWLMPMHQEASMQTICADRGEVLQVVLQDGTHIYLNADSRLVFPGRFTRYNRSVTLIGEAYFDVAKDKHHPFIVDLNGVSVEVLGTRFNVKAYENEPLQVNLDEGHVLFRGGSKSVDMCAGERLCYDRKTSRSILYHNANTRLASAWKEHRLEVNGMSMHELKTMLERQYAVDINIRDEQCYEYSYSLVVNGNKLENVLKGMSSVSPICYRYDEEKSIVTISAKR